MVSSGFPFCFKRRSLGMVFPYLIILNERRSSGTELSRLRIRPERRSCSVITSAKEVRIEKRIYDICLSGMGLVHVLIWLTNLKAEIAKFHSSAFITYLKTVIIQYGFLDCNISLLCRAIPHVLTSLDGRSIFRHSLTSTDRCGILSHALTPPFNVEFRPSRCQPGFSPDIY